MPRALALRRIALIAAGVALALSMAQGGVGPRTGAAEAATFLPTWRTFTTEDGLPDSSIRAIHLEGDEVWVGTDRGLARFSDGEWRSWTVDAGLPGVPVTAIDIDAGTGDAWLGTWGGGLVRLTGGRLDSFTQYNSGLAGDVVLDVVVQDGVVWAATNGGISSFEPAAEVWGLYLEARVDVPPHAATALCETDEGVYASTWCGPLHRFDPAGEEWVRVPDAAPGVRPGIRGRRRGGTAVVALADAGEALWWTSRGRLARRIGSDDWRQLRSGVPGGQDGFVTCLAAASDSEVWLGTSDGLNVLADWDTETWVTYRRGDVRGEGTVTFVRSGQVIGSRSVAPALPDDRIRCLASDGDGIWVGTPSGLAHGSGRTTWKATGGAVARPPSPAVPGVNPWRGEARIGMLASSSTPIPRPGSVSPWPAHPVDRVAVGRAVARADVRVERSGKTFVLADNLDSFSGFGWGTVQDSFPALRHDDEVSGIVAYIGDADRMDSALALLTELPVVNFAPTEPAIHESENPWVFRCGANDPRRPRRLLDHVLGSLGRSRPAAITTPGSESRAQLDRWIDQAAGRGLGRILEFEYDPEADDPESPFEELRRSHSDVLLTWADARTTAGVIRRLRAAGLSQLVVGGPQIVNDEFIALAGPDAGAVIALSRCSHFEVAGDLPPMDEATLRRRPPIARVIPTPQAGRSYDAAAHLLVAIELAGPAREEVRRALRAMGEPVLATLEGGAWGFSPLSDSESSADAPVADKVRRAEVRRISDSTDSPTLYDSTSRPRCSTGTFIYPGFRLSGSQAGKCR